MGHPVASAEVDSVNTILSQILYQDTYCILMPDSLCIKNYYFPMGESRFIPYTSIKGVCYQPERQVKGTSKCLGIGSQPVWWANDRGPRLSAAQFCVAVDCGEMSWKGFLVERVQDFLYAFTPLLPKEAAVSGSFPGVPMLNDLLSGGEAAAAPAASPTDVVSSHHYAVSFPAPAQPPPEGAIN